MRVLTVRPGVANSARLDTVPHPAADGTTLLIQMLALGVCGTDREIIAGKYGSPPPGQSRLILGHESLGRVASAPEGSGFRPGDLVVGIVRVPDPVPCPNCAVGEWDMCRNGQFTEHGIKERDGFGAEWVRLPPERVVRVDPRLAMRGVLLEPASVVAKAWEHAERIGQRAAWRPERALITGGGPIGQLAALLGAQRGLDVHVFDRNVDGPKPALVRSLGATYHGGAFPDNMDFDVVMECTGADPVIQQVLAHTRRNGIVCLTGISSGGRRIPLDLGQLNRSLVLENDVVFGSVNANRRHYEAAAAAMASADPAWLDRLITRRVPLDDWSAALEKRPGDIKVVVEFDAPAPA